MNQTELIHNLMDMLESLTPGGSEFKNNPKACIEFTRGRLAVAGKISAERNQLREKLKEAEKENKYLSEKLGYAHDGFLDKQKECDWFAEMFQDCRKWLERIYVNATSDDTGEDFRYYFEPDEIIEIEAVLDRTGEPS